jgi:hypothetical protein
MCPIDDSTRKSEPKKSPMVFALAGDSTITKGFAILNITFNHRLTSYPYRLYSQNYSQP